MILECKWEDRPYFIQGNGLGEIHCLAAHTVVLRISCCFQMITKCLSVQGGSEAMNAKLACIWASCSHAVYLTAMHSHNLYSYMLITLNFINIVTACVLLQIACICF